MTLYEKYKKLDIDFSLLGLEPDGARGGYFCTPKGAEIIGWAGVDGIHCCFVSGFGEEVFAVNPSNLPGDYVHPLARNFEDFLRLLLACGLDAAEQAWMWNRGEFDAFMETYPPGPAQQAALDTLGTALGLAPMEDPYGYIKQLQSGFDGGKLSYSQEYYALLPDPPETQGPPVRPAWKVYFEGGFSPCHTGHDKPGKEIPIGKTFSWNGKVWHIPAVYSCGKGLVVELCMEIDPAALRAFLDKWWPRGEEARELTPEDQERRNAENPMNVVFTPELTVNGRQLRGWSGSGSSWTPLSCRLEEERRGEYSQQDWEKIWLMEHYGLDPERGWMFWRYSLPWVTKTKPVLKTLSLTMKQDPVPVPGCRFTVSGAGDKVPFIHPVTGAAHTLHVAEYEALEMDAARFQDHKQWEYPTHCIAMSYVVEPELPRQSMTVRDCGQGDSPRLKGPDALATAADGPTSACSIGIIGGTDGPAVILRANSPNGQPHSAFSALYFDPPEQTEWRMVFYQKNVDDAELVLPLPQC